MTWKLVVVEVGQYERAKKEMFAWSVLIFWVHYQIESVVCETELVGALFCEPPPLPGGELMFVWFLCLLYEQTSPIQKFHTDKARTIDKQEERRWWRQLGSPGRGCNSLLKTHSDSPAYDLYLQNPLVYDGHFGFCIEDLFVLSGLPFTDGHW